MDLIIKARFYSVFKYVIRTFADRYRIVNEPQCFSYCPRRGVWTEIHRAIIFNLPHHLWIRKFLIVLEFNTYKGLIITKIDIKFWFKLLYQIIFEDEGFFLSLSKYKINVCNVSYQIFCVKSVVDFFLEISFHPIFQIFCLTYIDYFILDFLHKVDTRR